MARRSGRSIEPEQVLETAVAIAAETGLSTVSADAIAARLGVRPRAVARLHPNPDVLVAATFERIVEHEVEEAQQELLDIRQPELRLAALIDVLATPVPHLDAAWAEAWSLGRRNHEIGAVLRREEGAWHALIIWVLRGSVGPGALSDDELGAAATHLLAAVNAVNSYGLLDYHSHFDRLRMLHAITRTHLGAAAVPDPSTA